MRYERLIAHAAAPLPCILALKLLPTKTARRVAARVDGRDGRLGLSCNRWSQRRVERVDARPNSTQGQCREEVTTLMDYVTLPGQGAKTRYKFLNTAALLSQVHMLKISVAKQEARVLLRETIMRRRLRKNKLLRLCRW